MSLIKGLRHDVERAAHPVLRRSLLLLSVLPLPRPGRKPPHPGAELLAWVTRPHLDEHALVKDPKAGSAVLGNELDREPFHFHASLLRCGRDLLLAVGARGL